MSCYFLTPTNPNRWTCRVGWDSSVNSFFVYIAHPVRVGALGVRDTENDGKIIKWKGSEECELPTIEDVEREIEGFALLTDEIKEKLVADQLRASGAQEKGALQTQGTG